MTLLLPYETGLAVFKSNFLTDTPQPLYNMVCYSMVMDITQTILGSQIVILDSFLLYIYTFYSRYNMGWTAKTENSLNPNNSVIKRLWVGYAKMLMH